MKRAIKPAVLIIFAVLILPLAVKAQLPSQKPLGELLPESVKAKVKEHTPVASPQPAAGQLPSKTRGFLRNKTVAAVKAATPAPAAPAPSEAEKKKRLPSHSRSFLARRIRRSGN